MVQLIKKGGLRERANRSRKYVHSENNIKTLDPHRYIDNVEQHTSTLAQKEKNQVPNALDLDKSL